MENSYVTLAEIIMRNITQDQPQWTRNDVDAFLNVKSNSMVNDIMDEIWSTVHYSIMDYNVKKHAEKQADLERAFQYRNSAYTSRYAKS
ncbi:MAG: hypothetical protein ACXADH_05525 [Candidatus Kariarchaeaceae archaeon]